MPADPHRVRLALSIAHLSAYIAQQTDSTYAFETDIRPETMMYPVERFLVSFALAAFLVALLYGLFVRRLAHIVQPYRDELADLVDDAIGTDARAEGRNLARFCLDHARDGRVAFLAVFAIPAAALGTVARSLKALAIGGRVEISDFTPGDRRILGLFALSAFAANPLFGVISVIELFVVGLALVVMGGTTMVTAAIDDLLRAETAMPRLLGGQR